MYKINMKPLSVNDAWQGRRFKSTAYKVYETELYYQLPKIKVPDWQLRLSIEAGISRQADIDNISKPFIDVLQATYWFNDKSIMLLQLHKVIVKKWEEYISFEFNKYPC